MKEEPVAPPSEGTLTYKDRLNDLLASRRDKMFGVAEVLALGASGFILLLVLLSYLYFVVPARSNLSSLNEDRTRLQANLQKLGGIVKQGRDTGQTVEGIKVSLESFEKANLPREDQGRLGLYDELNQLILKNAVRNTSGPAYTSLDPAGTKATPGKAINTKWQSFYPGVSVMVTVEGSYQSVRHFIQDIERSKQFIVINEVELQRATDSSAPASEATSGNKASLVSLQLSLATYFQRYSESGLSGVQE